MISVLYKLASAVLCLLLVLFVIAGQATQVFAHGDETHENEQSKTTSTKNGIIVRTTKLNDFEITLKTPLLQPDVATTARLFITRYNTNEPTDREATISTVEIESSKGSVVQATVEETDIAGVYNLKIPALTDGNYTFRISLKTNKGSDTATFSGFEVAHATTISENGGASASWSDATLLFVMSAIVFGLFCGLLYFAWRMVSDESIKGELASR